MSSVIFFDSYFKDTPVAFKSSYDLSSSPPTGGRLVIENIEVKNVPVIVQGPGDSIALQGSQGHTITKAWAQGHSYIPQGPTDFVETFSIRLPRPASILHNGKYYARAKPQHADVPASQLVSFRSAGALGDGIQDDTNILQQVLRSAARSGRPV